MSKTTASLAASAFLVDEIWPICPLFHERPSPLGHVLSESSYTISAADLCRYTVDYYLPLRMPRGSSVVVFTAAARILLASSVLPMISRQSASMPCATLSHNGSPDLLAW